MSNDIFPPSGLRMAWNNVRTPEFRTVVESADDGRETRASKWVYPRWRWQVSFNAIGEAGHAWGDQLRPILGHYLKHRGAGDTFLFRDPEDYAITNQTLGTGDDVTKVFQIVRNYGGFLEPIYDVKGGTPVVKKAGVTQTYTATNPPPGGQYTISNGLVIFGTAPTFQVITISCEFYFRVRFAVDVQEYENFSYLLHAAREVELVSVKR